VSFERCPMAGKDFALASSTPPVEEQQQQQDAAKAVRGAAGACCQAERWRGGAGAYRAQRPHLRGGLGKAAVAARAAPPLPPARAPADLAALRPPLPLPPPLTNPSQPPTLPPPPQAEREAKLSALLGLSLRIDAAEALYYVQQAAGGGLKAAIRLLGGWHPGRALRCVCGGGGGGSCRGATSREPRWAGALPGPAACLHAAPA
jgi:hypothetical protein